MTDSVHDKSNSVYFKHQAAAVLIGIIVALLNLQSGYISFAVFFATLTNVSRIITPSHEAEDGMKLYITPALSTFLLSWIVSFNLLN